MKRRMRITMMSKNNLNQTICVFKKFEKKIMWNKTILCIMYKENSKINGENIENDGNVQRSMLKQEKIKK